jgi:hypothetical protein
VKLELNLSKASTPTHIHHHSLHITRTFRLLRINTSRATIMADSMEGVVVEGEQPKAENVEQKAIAGK